MFQNSKPYQYFAWGSKSAPYWPTATGREVRPPIEWIINHHDSHEPQRSQENTLEAGRTAMYCPPDQFQIVTWVANTADLRCARIYCIISVLCWLDFKHQGFIGICVDCSVVVVVVVVVGMFNDVRSGFDVLDYSTTIFFRIMSCRYL